MGRLAQALKSAREPRQSSDLIGGIEQAIIGHFASALERMIEDELSEAISKLSARGEADREAFRKASEVAVGNLKGMVQAQVSDAIQAATRGIPTMVAESVASIEIPAPQVIREVVESKPAPLTSVKVQRDEDGDIAVLNTNKGRFEVVRKNGLIVGIKRI